MPKKPEKLDLIEHKVEPLIPAYEKADLWSGIYRGDEEIATIGDKIGKWLGESPQ
jgi:hypothetical protein